MKVKVKSLSRVQLLATPWTAAHQPPPSMGFARQEYWSGCHHLLWHIFCFSFLSSSPRASFSPGSWDHGHRQQKLTSGKVPKTLSEEKPYLLPEELWLEELGEEQKWISFLLHVGFRGGPSYRTLRARIFSTNTTFYLTSSSQNIIIPIYNQYKKKVHEIFYFRGGIKWSNLWWFSSKESGCQCKRPVWSLGQEDPLEEGMATHSSILAWRIPWTEEPDRLESIGSHRVRHDLTTTPPPLSSQNLLAPCDCRKYG